MAIVDHFGASPGAVTAAIVTALDTALKMADGGADQGGTGLVRVIKDIPSVSSERSIEQSLTGGTPALLVSYEGGPFVKARANKKTFDQVMGFNVICIASQQDSVSLRLANDPTVKAGVLDLLDLATYYTLRALTAFSGLRGEKALAHQWVYAGPEKYVATATFEATRSFDAWEDDPSTEVESFGIVWDPTDYDDLWEADNTTPKSDWPPTSSGGVYDIDE